MQTQATRYSSVLAKGSNFTGTIRSLERRKGNSATQAILAEAPARLRDAVRFGEIMVGGWYPVQWYAELHAAIRRSLRVTHDFARILARDSIIADFSTLHRPMVGMRPAETLLAQADRLMKLYWKGGTLESHVLHAGAARVRFAGWHGFDRGVWEDIAGSAEGILQICRAQEFQVHATRGGRDGDSHLELELRWS
jgi:hypothetical protein